MVSLSFLPAGICFSGHSEYVIAEPRNRDCPASAWLTRSTWRRRTTNSGSLVA